MKETNLHTPGPWIVSTDLDEPEVVAELHTNGLAHFLIVPHPEYMGGLGDIAADARLVAAAPDLLEAASFARDLAMRMTAKSCIPYCAEFSAIAQELDAAIAKATAAAV